MMPTIRIDRDSVKLTDKHQLVWTLPIDEIRMIGESTTSNGPFGEDYFLCFSTGLTPWLEAPFSSTGIDGVVAQLGSRLGTELKLELFNSVDFESRILWPPEVCGLPMFSYSQGLKGSVVQEYSPTARQYLSDFKL
jgi:hypothetical protein